MAPGHGQGQGDEGMDRARGTRAWTGPGGRGHGQGQGGEAMDRARGTRPWTGPGGRGLVHDARRRP